MSNMNNQFYFVYGCNSIGEPTEKRVTDEAHLSVAIKSAREDFKGMKICVNKASFCFDGYFVQGDYIGSF
jgi:hypothetical protein